MKSAIDADHSGKALAYEFLNQRGDLTFPTIAGDYVRMPTWLNEPIGNF
jgi:hypothetical protein